jgi:hypothetical protein
MEHNVRLTAFEREVDAVLGIDASGAHFWRNFDKGCRDRGFEPPPRGEGLWQRVAHIQRLRNDYTHLNDTDLDGLVMVDASPTESAIANLREAVKDLHRLAGTEAPAWIDEDRLPRHPVGGSATLTVGHGLIDRDDPRNIQICFEYRGAVKTSDILPPDADPTPYMEQLARNVTIPISFVRAHQDGVIIKELPVRMRGSE